MSERHQFDWTQEQIERAEQGAVLILRNTPDAIPTQGLYTFCLCLFVVLQNRPDPEFSEKEITDLGLAILERHTFSKEFPFPKERIMRDILLWKAAQGAKDKLRRRKRRG